VGSSGTSPGEKGQLALTDRDALPMFGGHVLRSIVGRVLDFASMVDGGTVDPGMNLVLAWGVLPSS
jgi:hypothetical protein